MNIAGPSKESSPVQGLGSCMTALTIQDRKIQEKESNIAGPSEKVSSMQDLELCMGDLKIPDDDGMYLSGRSFDKRKF